MKSEDMSFSRIYSAIIAFKDEPQKFTLSQKTFNDLYDLAMKDMMNVEIDESKDRPFDPNSSIFGVPIKLDNRMKYGNWRIE